MCASAGAQKHQLCQAAAVREKVLAMEKDALAFLGSDEARGWVKKRTGNGHSLSGSLRL